MNLSKFGTKLTSKTGILELMEDLGQATNQPGGVYMLGGGNPAHIPEVEKILHARMEEILETPREWEHKRQCIRINFGRPKEELVLG